MQKQKSSIRKKKKKFLEKLMNHIEVSKSKKIESKHSQSHSRICWICHQSDSPSISQPFISSFFIDSETHKSFKPCKCKGSLGTVHKECLNLWAQKKYQSYLNLFSENEEELLFRGGPSTRNEFLIKCPNCKTPLKYEVMEKRVFKGLSSLKFDSNEKITLFLLILFQSLFLYLDLKSVYNEEVHERSWTECLSHGIYIFTVLVILSAGAFNFVDMIGKEVKVDVLNMEER